MTALMFARALAAGCFAILLSAAHPVHAMGPDDPGVDEELIKLKMMVDEGRTDEALPELERKAGMVPNDPNVLTVYGYGLRKAGEFDKSEAIYLQALDIDDDHLGAMNYLGHLYVETGRIEDAKAMLGRIDDSCFFGCKEEDELAQMIETGSSGKY